MISEKPAKHRVCDFCGCDGIWTAGVQYSSRSNDRRICAACAALALRLLADKSPQTDNAVSIKKAKR